VSYAGRKGRGFTLIELLVVVGIIIVMTAMSIPAVKKFMDGQRLSQSGRILQSAFNEARRAAITQRTRQYLVFYRETDANQQLLYGVVRYRERFGYEGDAHKLLPHVEVDMSTTYPAADPRAGLATGLNVTVFNGIPPQNHATYFQGVQLRPNLTSAGWIQFNRDGTITLASPLNPNLPPEQHAQHAGPRLHRVAGRLEPARDRQHQRRQALLRRHRSQHRPTPLPGRPVRGELVGGLGEQHSA
jgi:type II secretory pathway pseudopilin PulG